MLFLYLNVGVIFRRRYCAATCAMFFSPMVEKNNSLRRISALSPGVHGFQASDVIQRLSSPGGPCLPAAIVSRRPTLGGHRLCTAYFAVSRRPSSPDGHCIPAADATLCDVFLRPSPCHQNCEYCRGCSRAPPARFPRDNDKWMQMTRRLGVCILEIEKYTL